MTRLSFPVFLLLAMSLPACQPAPPPAPPAAPDTPRTAVEAPPGPTEMAGEPETVQPSGAESAASAPPAPQYSPEQMADARQLASDLAVLIREDDSGNVILIDTAANRSWVDDYQMHQLLVFPSLQTLTVEGPSITEHLAPRIAEAQGLTSLAMRNTLINDSGIEQLSGLKALRIIDLRLSSLLTDAAMDTLAAMPELRAVRLSGVNVTDTGVAKLLSLPNLTELDLRNCRKVTKAGIEQIGEKRSLRVVKLGGPEIDDEALELVAGMDHLTGLSLDNCDITDAGVGKLNRLPMEDFTIFQCANISDEGLTVLTAYDRLRRLTLRDVVAQGTALEWLPNPELLVELNMEQSGITDAQAPLLVRFTELESLNLSQTRLTDDAVEALSQLTWLKTLVLTQTSITDGGAAQLRQKLPDVSIRMN